MQDKKVVMQLQQLILSQVRIRESLSAAWITRKVSHESVQQREAEDDVNHEK